MREERTPGTPDYYRHRHALCRPCGLFYTWEGTRPIADARCTRCGEPLTRPDGKHLQELVETRTEPDQILAVGSPRFRTD